MERICDIIKNNDNFALAIHINPDGDCLGSASALMIALREMGKNAHIVLDGSVPERLSFLTEKDFFGNPESEYDVCISIDVAATYMMGKIEQQVFEKSKITCCLDHHGTNSGYADYNYVDSSSAATGEIVYEFIKNYLKSSISDAVAMRLYAAIASDTGSFCYSNTTSKTHKIASELIKSDFDAPLVMRKLFETVTVNQLKLKGEVISNLQFEFDGRVCIASVDRNLLDKYSLTFDATDDLASLPRSIEGVEVGIFLKIRSDNEVKASLRSNSYVDVSKIAASLGGGGHIRASGVTLEMSKLDALLTILNELKKVM